MLCYDMLCYPMLCSSNRSRSQDASALRPPRISDRRSKMNVRRPQEIQHERQEAPAGPKLRARRLHEASQNELTQKPPRAVGSCQELPRAAGSCREPSGASQESRQEPPGAVRSRQGDLGAVRSSPRSQGAVGSRQEPDRSRQEPPPSRSEPPGAGSEIQPELRSWREPSGEH